MKIFISSLISGMEPLRAAVKDAIETLGYDPIMAEDFAASPSSAQVACLQGIRQADAVILLCGERYGYPQASGISATHEEYREAREQCPVFVFVQSGISPEEEQQQFIQEVQQWVTGHYTNSFTNERDLQKAITRSLHQWSLTQNAGAVEPEEMLIRAAKLLPKQSDGSTYRPEMELAIVVTGGPRQSILRPSQLENPNFIEKLTQMALFGKNRIFTRREATEDVLRDHALILAQNSRSLLLDEQGSVSLRLDLPKRDGMVILEEDVRDSLIKALIFINSVLQEIDGTERLSHVAIKAMIKGGSRYSWKLRKDYIPNPSSFSINMFFGGNKAVELSPPHRNRSAFRLQYEIIAEDLITLLRRNFQQQSY